MKLRIRDILLGIAIPFMIIIVIAVVFFSGKIQSSVADVESIFHDTLFEIDTTLINADRDLYQAAYAMQGLYYSGDMLDDASRQSLIDDYNDNVAQVKERV